MFGLDSVCFASYKQWVSIVITQQLASNKIKGLRESNQWYEPLLFSLANENLSYLTEEIAKMSKTDTTSMID